MNTELKNQLKQEGYYMIREIPNRGICAIYPFIFTIAIVYGIDNDGSYLGRYCYPRSKCLDAILSLQIWDGDGDPDGEWIKHKGGIEYSNREKCLKKIAV